MSESKLTLEDEAAALQEALWNILSWDQENLIPDELHKQAMAAIRPQFAPSKVNADLLEACEAALPYLRSHIGLTPDGGPGDRVTLDMCEDIIAKAKGERQ